MVVYVQTDVILLQNTTVYGHCFMIHFSSVTLRILGSFSTAGCCGERKDKVSKAMRGAEFGPAAEGKATRGRFASWNYRTYSTELFRERRGNSI